MTIQKNIDYRVSVLDKVGVKIMDTDGTQRPITAGDLKEIKSDLQFVWMSVRSARSGAIYIDGVFSDEASAKRFCAEEHAYWGPHEPTVEYRVEGHEVRS